MRAGILALAGDPGVAGGVDSYVRSLVEVLSDQGTDLWVLAADAGAWAYRDWPSHVRLVNLPARKSVRRWTSLFATRYDSRAAFIDRLGLDVVHFPSNTISVPGLRTPTVLTLWDIQHEFHSAFFTMAELNRRRASYGRSVEQATIIMVPSRFTLDTAGETYEAARGKLRLVHAWVDRRFRKGSLEEIEQVRREYGLPADFMLYPANPWPHKNHARLLRAMRILRDQGTTRITLIVSGRLKDERLSVAPLAIAAGVDDQVRDLGFLHPDVMPLLYSAATTMIFPSLFEGFGFPPLEAMACLCPVVASNAAAIPECVGDAAAVCDPTDPSSIAEAIERVLQDGSYRHELISRGVNQARRFSADDAAAKVLDVYREAARA